MVVKTHSKGRGLTGLHVGDANVRRYFPKDVSFIELELDHLQIQCDLGPGFWQGEPGDLRSSSLRLARVEELPHPAKPHSRADDPSAVGGKNSFKLQPMRLHGQAKLKHIQSSAA